MSDDYRVQYKDATHTSTVRCEFYDLHEGFFRFYIMQPGSDIPQPTTHINAELITFVCKEDDYKLEVNS